MAEPFLIGNQMTGGYGGADILHSCTIAVEKCEIAVIVGPNGAGKSTAMKAVFGMLKLREGPGLNHKIIIGLPDGTRLVRQNCVTNNGKLWCKVALADRPGVSGYVSAEYLALR